MALEAGTFLDDLVISNPVGASDFVSLGDDHIRLLKKVIKNSFPGQNFPIGLVVDTGAADIYVGAMSPAPASLINGTIVMFLVVNANTGASTFNLNTLGAQSITLGDGKPLIGGELAVGTFVMLQYDSASTDWQMLSLPASMMRDGLGTDVASTASPNIWAENPGTLIHITGTTGITGFAAAPYVGARQWLVFDDAVLLTDDANLNLPGGIDYTTATDDMMLVVAETTTLFKVLIFPVSGNSVIGTLGKHTIWIPAESITPLTTDGCDPLAQVEGTAGRPEQISLDFSGAADQNAQFGIAFPKGWDEGTITFQAFWTSSLAGAGTVIWQLQAVALANDDLIDTAYGTGIDSVDTFGAIDDMHVSPESSVVTIAGTPAEDEMVYFKILRDTVSDTKAEVAKLLGIKLFFTVEAVSDE